MSLSCNMIPLLFLLLAGGTVTLAAQEPRGNDRPRWDRRYAAKGYVYGKEPTRFLKERAALLPSSGRALGLASGEGRNEVFLAGLGLEVTGIDISPVALEKCRRLATERKVKVKTVAMDLADWKPAEGRWDLITVINFHDPSLFPRIRRALRPGGLVLIESYSIDQLRFKGGPRDPRWLIKPGELIKAFQGFRILVYEDLVVERDRPRRTRKAVIRMIARKPPARQHR